MRFCISKTPRWCWCSWSTAHWINKVPENLGRILRFPLEVETRGRETRCNGCCRLCPSISVPASTNVPSCTAEARNLKTSFPIASRALNLIPILPIADTQVILEFRTQWGRWQDKSFPSCSVDCSKSSRAGVGRQPPSAVECLVARFLSVDLGIIPECLIFQILCLQAFPQCYKFLNILI